MNRDDAPFYVGYRPRTDARTSSFLRTVVVAIGAIAVGVAVAAAALHPRAGDGVFEWGTTREFEGTARAHPVARLEIAVPGTAATYEVLLVGAFKHGATAMVAPFDGHRVRARGTLIHRGNAAMLELGDAPLQDLGSGVPAATAEVLGQVVLRGEIVDSKCYLGVMKPGHLKPHRDCAVRCISGGVPPVLMVRDIDDVPTYYVLIGPHGEPVNAAVLDFVAEPVEVPGSLERSGNLLFLRIDPATISRLEPQEGTR